MILPVKICGITGEDDALKAAEAGADYIGIIVEFAGSPRSLTLERARAIRRVSEVPVVVLIADMDIGETKKILRELSPYALQLIGEESPQLIRELKEKMGCVVWKSLHFPVKDQAKVDLGPALRKVGSYLLSHVDALVLDTFDRTGGRGGTGKVFDWGIGKELVGRTERPVFLAGGITPDNVRQAIEEVKPYGIDLSSGVESSVGKKDAAKLNALMETVRVVREEYGP